MHLFDIKFPIFSITKSHKRIWEEMNVLYVETLSGTYVLDNKNIDEDTLGKRRVRMQSKDKYIPRKVYYTLAQMIRSKDKYFIDNTGRAFKYEKRDFVPLKYHRVLDVRRDENSGECIVELEGINFPQLLSCKLAHSISYVGVLHTKYGYILYSFEEEYKGDTKRKI